MDGILMVIKPPGMTSFDVVAWLRGIFKIRKIGHAGTLDPAAAGLLPICIGKATKAIDWFQDYDKSYRTEMTLGVVTNTQDAEGEIVEVKKVTADSKTIIETLKTFVGVNEQIPPMFSAVKIKGEKLYNLARKGIEVERKGRKVTITKIAPLEVNKHGENTIVHFDVDCSKGTYIRTLCHDIGQRLGCGAYMSFLIRTRVGPFSVAEAVTLEEIEQHRKEGTLMSVLKPVDVLFQNFDAVYLDKQLQKRFLNGALAEYRHNKPLQTDETVRVYSKDNIFLGLGIIVTTGEKKLLKTEKLFVPNNLII